jgi:hypothetical protein
VPADRTGSFAFLLLGTGSGRPLRREEPDLLRWEEERGNGKVRVPSSSMGKRAGVRLDVTGEGSFEAFVAVAFLPLALIWFVGLFPAGQRGRVRLNSRRPELSVNKVSAVKLR